MLDLRIVYFTPATISASQYFTKQLQAENICELASTICVREENREENSHENLRAAAQMSGSCFN